MPYSNYEKQKENALQNYYRNKEKKLKQVREYYYSHHEKRKAQKKIWADKNVEKLIEYRRTYRAKYKDRNKKEQRARWKLHNAIRQGKMKRIIYCSECNERGLLHAHHKDYAKPLDVEWLCHQCHFKKHRRG